MNDKKSLLDSLRGLKVQTGSLACLGCGHEHNCSTQGCAILRDAELVVACSLVHQCRNCDFYEGGLCSRCFNKKSVYVGRMMRPEAGCDHCSIELLTESEKARSDLAKRLAAAQQRADSLWNELQVARSSIPRVHAEGKSDEAPQTNGDRLRCRSDEELAEMLYQHYLSFADRDGAEDPSVQWCDMQGGCGGEGGGECTTELHKACILRWLRAKAEEVGRE